MFHPLRRVGTPGQHLLGSSGSFDGRESSAAPPEQRRGWFLRAVSHLHIFLGFLWIVPAVILLLLDRRATIVGASIGCPSCRLDSFGDSTQQQLKLSRDDHNALGGLQVASKAFEVWFMFVAASLVYDVTMFMAERRGQHIPLGFLTTYLEFGDLRYFLTMSPWTTPLRAGATFMKSWWSSLKLYGFLAFVVGLSLTANLMGPGSAVLLLPTQQYRNTSYVNGPVFGELAMAGQPIDPSISPNCSATQLLAGNYTCLADTYASSLDGLLTYAVAGFAQEQDDSGFLNIGLSPEQEVTVQFNLTCDQTDDCSFYLAPSRQILRNMSSDFRLYYNDAGGGTLDPLVNNSLHAFFHRAGPSVAQSLDCEVGNVTVANLAVDRTIRCYGFNGWDTCVLVGRGWGHDTDNSSFSLSNTDATVGDVAINIYSSAVAAYMPWSLTRCGATDESCWNASLTSNEVSAILLTEFKVPHLSNSNKTLYCVAEFFPSASHYMLDPGKTNDVTLVRLVSTQFIYNNSQKVHPDWLLAAWSTHRGGTVDAHSPAAQVIVNYITKTYQRYDPTKELSDELVHFSYLQHLIHAQSMSLVGFTTTSPDPSKKNTNPKPFTLDSWTSVYVYAYGNDSRTATLGQVVILIGIVATLVRTGTAIARRERTKSALELLTVALKHRYGGEFEGKATEAQKSRVRVGVDRLRRGGRKEFELRFRAEDGGDTGREGGRVYWGDDGSGSGYDSFSLRESPQAIRGFSEREETWGR
ncbi:MAG: hypothetical protein M1813_008801 [Trichoglossum hirsutum]|nr:MAG: hypothetical protein M1813_008801 [Trichoglossum hirsutum]